MYILRAVALCTGTLVISLFISGCDLMRIINVPFPMTSPVTVRDVATEHRQFARRKMIAGVRSAAEIAEAG
jgi:hypothetical protein